MFKLLLKKYEKQIYKLAERGVKEAEIFIGSGKGQQKKQMAIDFILKYLPLPIWLQWLKPVINTTLHKLIDKAIEECVEKMNETLNKLKEG
ncbi:MAG: hypothetical protein BHW64_01920 [Candidatus Melainabacteria bacterium LEY3_CP_29_8]|nr:MAG: hypothetical protein BHW64_01920 [Candidatus Melainabacteria bacterium LEY3_CP_29_8]